MTSGHKKDPVLQYDLQGNFISEHDSITDAVKAIGGKGTTNISRVCLGSQIIRRPHHINKLNNHYTNLRCVDHKTNMNNPLTISKTSKKIHQISSDGNVVNEFPSIADAARKTGYGSTSISDVVNNKKEMSNGFKWVLVY